MSCKVKLTCTEPDPRTGERYVNVPCGKRVNGGGDVCAFHQDVKAGRAPSYSDCKFPDGTVVKGVGESDETLSKTPIV